jgi:hypothetical protein
MFSELKMCLHFLEWTQALKNDQHYADRSPNPQTQCFARIYDCPQHSGYYNLQYKIMAAHLASEEEPALTIWKQDLG